MNKEYITIHAILREIQDGEYTTYVWENLNANNLLKFVTCVKLPNWECLPIKVGDTGYLQYRIVVAGQSTWYDPISKETNFYNYDGLYFHSFIKEREIIKINTIKY